jgi:hypothetical protein
MAGEANTITISVTTLDIDQWHPGWRAAAEASRLGYHGWAVDGLRRAIEQAVQSHVRSHPDLFAHEPDVA